MPEIEAELIMELTPHSIKTVGMCDCDKIFINHIDLTPPQAAALAWLLNQPLDTVLQLELKVKP